MPPRDALSDYEFIELLNRHEISLWGAAGNARRQQLLRRFAADLLDLHHRLQAEDNQRSSIGFCDPAVSGGLRYRVALWFMRLFYPPRRRSALTATRSPGRSHAA